MGKKIPIIIQQEVPLERECIVTSMEANVILYDGKYSIAVAHEICPQLILGDIVKLTTIGGFPVSVELIRRAFDYMEGLVEQLDLHFITFQKMFEMIFNCENPNLSHVKYRIDNGFICEGVDDSVIMLLHN